MLILNNVLVGYGSTPVLELDHFHLQPGEQCLITGPSGCGKTTLLFAIAGLHPLMRGHVTVAGTNITQLSEAKRDHFRARHIGMVFQTLHLMRSLDVMQNVLLASYAAELPQSREHAHQLLEKLGIEHKHNVLPETISQGQAQRVAIARAVMHRPSLILADEPTSSLDDAACEKVILLLKSMAHNADAALLVSTHDQRVARHFTNILALGKAA